MADDQDKSQQTEDPTAKRLEQARESGDVVDIGLSHLALGSTSATISDNATAREHLEAALSIFRLSLIHI